MSLDNVFVVFFLLSVPLVTAVQIQAELYVDCELFSIVLVCIRRPSRFLLSPKHENRNFSQSL